MPDTPKPRGGSHSARRRGDVGAVVHFAPADYEELKRAARLAGLPVKELCRLASLAEARAVLGRYDCVRPEEE